MDKKNAGMNQLKVIDTYLGCPNKKRPVSLSLNVSYREDDIQFDESDIQGEKSVQRKSNIELPLLNQRFDYEEEDSKKYDDFQDTGLFYDTCMKICSRNYQEDRFTIYENELTNEWFFGIFDGHKTYRVAQILKQNLHKRIFNNQPYQAQIRKAITECYRQLDQEIIQFQKDNNFQGGSTSVCAILKQDKVIVFYCGDSSCIIVSKDKVKKLTLEHTPSLESEYQMLLCKKCIILDRHNQPRIQGELAVSRSFGDEQYKQFIIVDPSFEEHEINNEDTYLILGSDGFWDIIKYTDIPDLISQYQLEKQKSSLFNKTLSQFLIDKALEKHVTFKIDNMTLQVVDLLKYQEYLQKKNSQQKQQCSQISISSNQQLTTIKPVKKYSLLEDVKSPQLTQQQKQNSNSLQFQFNNLQIEPEQSDNRNVQSSPQPQKTSEEKFSFMEDDNDELQIKIKKKQLQGQSDSIFNQQVSLEEKQTQKSQKSNKSQETTQQQQIERQIQPIQQNQYQLLQSRQNVSNKEKSKESQIKNKQLINSNTYTVTNIKTKDQNPTESTNIQKADQNK